MDMAKNKNKIQQNYQALVFILHFFAAVIFLVMLYEKTCTLFKLHLSFPDFSDKQYLVFLLILSFAYFRLYWDYLKNKRWNS